MTTEPANERAANFHRMMRRRGGAWLPLDVRVTAPVADQIERRIGTRNVVEAFDLDFDGFGPVFAHEPERWRQAFDALGVALPEHCEIGGYGITHAVPPAASIGQAYHLREMLHPLAAVTDVAQLERLPWPKLDDPALDTACAANVHRIHADGRVAVGHCACTIFEHAWYLRGMDMLFADLIDGSDVGPWLLDWFTERSVRAVGAMARAGVDCIWFGDDVGTQRGMMMSVPFWREHLKPRLTRVVEAIRRHQRLAVVVNYHSDGDVRDIIDDLVEVGIDSLNPGQPERMPVAEAAAAQRHHLAFWGMVGTQSTMPFGTPADVRQVVAGLAKLARDGAGIVVAPTHVLEPEVPWDNILALVDAVRHV